MDITALESWLGEAVARMVAATDRKIEAEGPRKAALQALFKAILHQLMTGQGRLPKSPRLQKSQ